MSLGILKTHIQLAGWAKAVDQKSAAVQFCVLALAAALMVAHYAFDELAYHPERCLWTAPVFWAGAWGYAAVPFMNWLAWISMVRRINALKPILAMSTVLCAGSIVAFYVPITLHAIGAMHLLQFGLPVEKWHWSKFRYYWGYSTSVVLVIGNVALLWRWRRRATPQTSSRAARHGGLLTSVAIMSVALVCAVSVLHLLLPQLPANRSIVGVVRSCLVEAHLRNDFDYLIQHSFSLGRPLAPLLTHVELANLQRRQFYSSLDVETFRRYILSPDIDALPLPEVDWRRTLWENFYPRIRRERDPMEAAKTVVRFLRERVGVDAKHRYRVGVETIWAQQMTDETGFARIYVAALRSVGIAARLSDRGQVELLKANQWEPAPEVLVSSFEDEGIQVPQGGLVNFQN